MSLIKLSLFIATTPIDTFHTTRSIGVTINKHSPFIPMDIDNNFQPAQHHTSILDGIESRTTDWTPPLPILVEDFLPVVEKKKQDPFIASELEKALHQGNLLKFAEDLPKGLKEPLFSTTGKNTTSMKHPNASFIGEYCFCHLVPFLYTGNHLSTTDKKNLKQCCRSAKMFSTL